MSDERLKEIKDSINLQLEVIKQLNIDNELVPEEKELYDYAELLKERVSCLEKSIVRKEETIAELEQERVPYTNEYVDKVDKKNKELKKQVEEYRKTNEHLLDKKQFLKQENQLLKKQLKEANKKLYLCTPEIPQNIHGKYVSYVDLVNEMYELKKLNEQIQRDGTNLLSMSETSLRKISILKTQQKEFIKYLENMLDDENDIFSVVRVKDVLQKYKEIVGVSDENKTTI